MDNLNLECNYNIEDSSFKYVNSYHFLFINQDKVLKNYSEDEVIFYLEIKGKKVS